MADGRDLRVGIEVSADVDFLVGRAGQALQAWRALPALERGVIVARAEGLLEAQWEPSDPPLRARDRAGSLTARGPRPVAADRGVVAVLGAADDRTGLAFWHLLPLLADGNTVVFAPHPGRWGLAEQLARLLSDAGLPCGVLSLLHDPDGRARELLLRHRGVSLVVALGTSPPRVGAPERA